ncbi:MAG TPA: lysophospholipid acyltransferase family protein [Bacteroidota bacterium]|nr:lysophospholipid acyltransferase family protein [Bacteroidota bacterium]
MNILKRILLAPVSIAFALMAWVMRRIGERNAEKLSRILVGIALASQRGRRLRNMRRVFSEWNEEQIRRLNKEHMRYISRLMVEFLRLPELADERFQERFSIEGEEHIQEALRRGRGILLLGSHLGNWWYARSALSLRGYRISTISNRIPVRGIESQLEKIRNRFNIRGIHIGEGGSSIAADTFGRNEIFSLAFDVSSPGREGKSLRLPIGGATINIDLGPAALACKHNPAVLHLNIRAIGNRRSHIIIKPASHLMDSDKTPTNPADLTRSWIDGLSVELREFPEQWWHWSHLILEVPALHGKD